MRITAATCPPSVDPPSPPGARPPSRRPLPPSATEEEAKSRFVSALSEGVGTLLERGYGRERASEELLGGIADGCSPGEDEIFQTMESLGLSLSDATKVMTVSSAFRKTQTSRGGSTIAVIDELTSRLNLGDFSGRGRSRSPSPTPSQTVASVTSTLSHAKFTELSRNDSGDSFQSRPLAAPMAKNVPRPSRATKHHPQQGKGRKRALAEKTPEKIDGNVLLAEAPKGKAAKVDLEVKEKMRNAKLSKAEGKKPKVVARAKSPEGGLGARGKRTAALHVEESPSKRPRTRSQTEESIPAI
ncbi:hypothetical protein ACHAWF_001380 [Thalassiosira exigua]